MEIPFLTQIVIIFGITVAVLYVCHRFRIPTVVGFLISGVLAGPSVLGLVTLTEEVRTLSEIGVVMLLFTIGIEFSLNNLVQIRKYVILGGALQVFITLGVTAAICIWAGFTPAQATFMGFLISLSSTAIVLKIFQQSDGINTPHARTSLAILIFQDIVVVPMMLITPILAGGKTNLGQEVLLLILKGAGIIIITFLSAQYLMPRILFQVARTRSQEIFLISIIVICFAVAWLTSSIGLSLSLGAFLAGLIISRSEYSHQALSSVMPFRDLFTSLFFISIGMLLDVDIIRDHPLPIIMITLGVLFLKTIIGAISTFMLGFPLRTVLLVGVALSQVGEFSFVLAGVAINLPNGTQLLDHFYYQVFLAVSILTMAISPFLIPFSHWVSDALMKLGPPRWLAEGWLRGEYTIPRSGDFLEDLTDHIIIVGFGVGGRNVAWAAKTAGIPYAIVEMNPDTVRKSRRQGQPIIYGDAIQEGILENVHINKARVLVVAIPDPIASRAIVRQAKRLNPSLFTIVRTHYMHEIRPLFKLGADEVVPEEFETSIEIFTMVLMKYLVPKEKIDEFITQVRADGYHMFRSKAPTMLGIADLQNYVSGMDISNFIVPANSPLIGVTLADANIRQVFQVSLLALIRKGEAFANPSSDTKIMEGDRIIIFGQPDYIYFFAQVLFGRKPIGADK
jgi:monovalent cation:H+ antiporter-2, CPA2 family